MIEEPGPSDGVGRNRDVLRFNQRAGAVIAIDLGGTKCHGASPTWPASIVAEDQRPTFAGGSPAGSLLASIAALRDGSGAGGPGRPRRVRRYSRPRQPGHRAGGCRAECALAWLRPDGTAHGQSWPSRSPSRTTSTWPGLGEAWQGGGAGDRFLRRTVARHGHRRRDRPGRAVVRGQHNAAGEVGYLVTRPSQLLRGVPAAGLEELISGCCADRTGPWSWRRRARSATELDPAAHHAGAVFEAAAAGDEVGRGGHRRTRRDRRHRRDRRDRPDRPGPGDPGRQHRPGTGALPGPDRGTGRPGDVPRTRRSSSRRSARTRR